LAGLDIDAEREYCASMMYAKSNNEMLREAVDRLKK
jgi:hypothetical protein